MFSPTLLSIAQPTKPSDLNPLRWHILRYRMLDGSIMQLHGKEGECQFLILASNHLGCLIDHKNGTFHSLDASSLRPKKIKESLAPIHWHRHIHRSDLFVRFKNFIRLTGRSSLHSDLIQIRQNLTGNWLTHLDMGCNEPGPDVNYSIHLTVVCSPSG